MTDCDDDDWVDKLRATLYERWVSTTGHSPDANNRTWACEIAFGCRHCNEHLSLPCSLLREANEIGLFLHATCFAARPDSFLRFYLILLSEFVNQLHDLANLLRLEIGKPPKEVVVWANRWAKHRLHVLVQHHPEMVFADQYGDEWPELERGLSKLVCEDRCGHQRPAMLIDTAWLCAAVGKQPDLAAANGEAKAVIVVPPMQCFLDRTIRYFRSFIDAALKFPDAVREYRSEHAVLRC